MTEAQGVSVDDTWRTVHAHAEGVRPPQFDGTALLGFIFYARPLHGKSLQGSCCLCGVTAPDLTWSRVNVILEPVPCHAVRDEYLGVFRLSGESWRYRLNSAFKLQALVYDILPSTTAVFTYAIGSRKLSANEQFFVGTQTVASLLQTTQIILDVCFITEHVAYASSDTTKIV